MLLGIFPNIYTYIYIYTHTHTHTYIYIYIRGKCRVDGSSFECARHKQQVAERVHEYKEAIKHRMGLQGYTPYADEAAEHLRNAAVASKYERMAREAHKFHDIELANKILKEFQSWSLESKPQRDKAVRQFGDGSVGPVGHAFAAFDKKHHELDAHAHHHLMTEAAKTEEARIRASNAHDSYERNQEFHVLPQRFPHEDGAGLCERERINIIQVLQ